MVSAGSSAVPGTIEHKPVPLGSLDSHSSDVRDFGRAADTLNVDINRVNEPQRRLGMVRRLDAQQSGPIRLMFSYAGLCSRYFELVGGGGLILVRGDYYGGILVPGGQPGVSVDETQITTPTPDVQPLSVFTANPDSSVALEWRFPDGTKLAPFGAEYVVVLRKIGSEPDSIDDEDATEIYRGLGSSYVDEDVNTVEGVFYKAWVQYTTGLSDSKSASSLANIIFVDPTAAAGGNGRSWGTAYNKLQDAVDDYEYGDEIWIAPGTLTRKGTDTHVADTSGLDDADVVDMKIYGAVPSGSISLDEQDYESQSTVLDGESACSHAFNFDGDLLTIVGVDAQGGTGLDEGVSGLFADHRSGDTSSVVATGCLFTGIAGNFYSLEVSDGDITVSGCNFSGGLGVSVTSSSTPNTVDASSCSFSDGARLFHSAVGTVGNSVTVTGCSTIDLLVCTNAAVNITNCTWKRALMRNLSSGVISSCTASSGLAVGNGGGMSIESCDDLSVTSCTISGCSATHRGGGIYITSPSTNVLISGCTFINNTAGIEGGAVYNQGSVAVLSSNTYSGNVPDDVAP
jgi:hypothetical protein